MPAMALLHFTRDVDGLKSKFLRLFAFVEETLQKSIRAYWDRDAAAAQEVISDDHRIDGAEVMVEEDCLKILALHQPIAQDLRYIVSLLKINRDLERIGDQSKSIANIALQVSDRALPEVPELRALADQVVAMLRESFASVINLDIEQARRVWREDDRADAFAQEALARLQAQMRTQPERLEHLLPIYSLVFILERVGDHAANIAKDVLYTISGEIVRHRGHEFKHTPLPPEAAKVGAEI